MSCRLDLNLRAASFVVAVGCLVVVTTSAIAKAYTPKTVLKFATAAESRAHFDQAVRPVFVKSCAKCHNEKTSEGELNIAVLDPDMKASTSAARWAMVVEKISSREMPPKEGTPLADADLQAINSWIAAEMKRSGKHLAKREAYDNGNKIPHHMLFDPLQKAPLDVPPRIRTVSPEIYATKSRKLSKGFEDLVSQPFSPSGKTTFKDMALAKVDEPVTAQLIRNALVIVERQTSFTIVDGTLKGLPGSQKDFLPFVDERVPLDDAAIKRVIVMQFKRVLDRDPSADELTRFTGFMQKNVAEAGRVAGVRYTLAAVFLLPEGIFRYELGSGPADAKGRVRLTPREIATAISLTLTDDRPPAWLVTAADKGELDTAEGVAAATEKLLADPKLNKPRIMRFFREYFGYDRAIEVFKEPRDFSGHDSAALVADTDRLIQLILEQDRDVLKELLTTNKSFVAYKSAAEWKKQRAEALAKFEAEKAKDPKKYATKKPSLPGKAVYESYSLTDFPDVQPVELPSEQRAGILTQPAWLVAWSMADDNHAILRGKWVRERLLGGVVPDIPITVDAQLPDEPQHTLRERMRVTTESYCWQCHQYMNRVGLPFEMFDHFGRYREVEQVLDIEATAKNVDPKNGKNLGKVLKDIAVDATGGFEFTLDPALTGDVKNGIEFIHKIANSEAVEQVFIRHAFRYWLGRNETLGDAQSLQRAQAAYRAKQGSHNALLASLLSSDSFLYRVPTNQQTAAESGVTPAK